MGFRHRQTYHGRLSAGCLLSAGRERERTDHRKGQ